MHLISTSVDRKVFETISMCTTCTTAHDMWNRLSLLHQQKSQYSTSLLLQRFQEYQMDPADSVGQHFAKVRNLARTLNELNQGITDTVIMRKILTSLPSRFLNSRSAWNSVNPERKTLTYLECRLIEEESIMNKGEQEALALAATRKFVPKADGQSKRNNKSCNKGSNKGG